MFIKGTYTSVGVFFSSSTPLYFLSEKYKVWGTTFYIEFRRIACVSKRGSGFVFASDNLYIRNLPHNLQLFAY